MVRDISKLPKWAQEHIAKLESKLNESKTREAALRILLDGSPTIAPDILPPEEYGAIVNGWHPLRLDGRVEARKYCAFSGYYDTSWNKPRSEFGWSRGSVPLYSSAELAIRSLLPQIVEAYVKEMAHALSMIERYKKEENDRELPEITVCKKSTFSIDRQDL